MATDIFYGTGRRKSSTRASLSASGHGSITVNEKPLDTFFGRKTARMIVRQPLDLTELGDKFDVTVRVSRWRYDRPGRCDIATV